MQREFAFGVEALERFVACEPLRRVHECFLTTLALESDRSKALICAVGVTVGASLQRQARATEGLQIGSFSDAAQNRATIQEPAKR